MGTNDLAKDMGLCGWLVLMMVLQMCLLVAKVAGIVVLDGVYNVF